MPSELWYSLNTSPLAPATLLTLGNTLFLQTYFLFPASWLWPDWQGLQKPLIKNTQCLDHPSSITSCEPGISISQFKEYWEVPLAKNTKQKVLVREQSQSSGPKLSRNVPEFIDIITASYIAIVVMVICYSLPVYLKSKLDEPCPFTRTESVPVMRHEKKTARELLENLSSFLK